jgi:hypothetical protein
MKPLTRPLALVALSLAACTPSTTKAPPAPALAPAQPVAAASSTKGAPSASTGAEPSASASRFHEIARTKKDPSEPELRAMDNQIFVSVDAGLWPIRDGRVVAEESLSEGLTGFGAIVGVAGHWPDDAWVTFITGNGRIGWGELYRWSKTVWMHDSSLNQGRVFLGFSSWSQHRLLAMAIDTPMLGPPRVEFRVPGGKRPALKLTPGSGTCPYAINPLAFAATRRGDVFVFGSRCTDDEEDTPQAAAVEWFAPGASKSTLVPIESQTLAARHIWEDTPFAFADRDGDEIVACLGGGPLVRFDGKSFRAVDSPHGGVESLAYAGDGTLWAVATGAVYSRGKAGKWRPEPLPAGAAPALRVLAQGDAVYVQSASAVYGLGPLVEPAPVLEYQWGRTPRSFKIAWPATKDCETPFVLLYAFTKVTPTDYDFPLTRAALKGHTEFASTRFVVTREGDKRYFGAFVPSYVLGKKLVGLVEKKVNGSKPAMLCANPVVERELAIDLVTGNAKK